eukprot:3047276-Rhodomonas_salina.1
MQHVGGWRSETPGTRDISVWESLRSDGGKSALKMNPSGGPAALAGRTLHSGIRCTEVVWQCVLRASESGWPGWSHCYY